MGLDTSHDCWHGPYSQFHLFRSAVCEAAGLGNLRDYRGFGGDKEFPKDPISYLLDHSDCDGEIPQYQCGPLADRLEQIKGLPLEWQEDLANWIKGLRAAFHAGEAVDFH